MGIVRGQKDPTRRIGSLRGAFLRQLWRYVRSWIIVTVAFALLAVVLGPVYGYGEVGPVAIPILGFFDFLFALPGSLLIIAIVLRSGFDEDYSLEARLARVGGLSVASAASVILIALQTPGVKSPSDAFALLVLVVPAALVWEIIDG